MDHKKILCFTDKYRPGAHALVGAFFIKIESLNGSIFLPAKDET
jgi:hypothetical protein